VAQLEHIEAIEKRLWSAADNLRANSNYASNEYFMPVMGLIFLRHAYNRFLTVQEEIAASLPSRGGRTPQPTKEDYSRRGSIFLRNEAQFDYLVKLTDGEDRARAIIAAMESIESDYESLRDTLPKSEYQELDNAVLGQLLRTLNPDELRRVSGDVFGRIYEYFLTQFADQKAHDGGEFFTPVSLVSLIAHTIQPDRGTVLDPAAGSGGMFVQSARTVQNRGMNPAERLTFRGIEKNATTIRLARMNLAVHGLEGDIKKAITYYEDPHNLVGRTDYVMANPPFNVDEIDAEKVKRDPRLPFGLPGVNKKGKVTNGNYVWISYFYSYLNERGRAGFVMSSQASSAGRDEATVRQKLVETGDVEIMIAIRSNFFYTRTVPCELWFLNRNKPDHLRDTVLMIDARGIYRKVTRKIYDFSPEQEQNILAIVSLYRGDTDAYLRIVHAYCRRTVEEGARCVSAPSEGLAPLPAFLAAADSLTSAFARVVAGLPADDPQAETIHELDTLVHTIHADIEAFGTDIAGQESGPGETTPTAGALTATVERLRPLAETSRDVGKQIDLAYKLAARVVDAWTPPPGDDGGVTRRELTRLRKSADDARAAAVEQLRLVRYFHKQAHWLTSRFPDARLTNVEGLVKLVGRDEIAAGDWSLTPGRYVGVAPEEEDDDFDFEETLREIHVELDDLNAEATRLAETIRRNFEELGV